MHQKSQTHKNLALFDFDGTLCKKDSFSRFFFFALSKGHIMQRGIKILPWIMAYYLRQYPAHLMRPKLFHAMLSHVACSPLENIAVQYAQSLLQQQLDPHLYQQLLQHQALGDDVVLVSASIDIYLKPIAQALAIDLICTETEIQQQHYSGRYLSADCSGQQKKIRILQQYDLSNYQSIYAYGNSEEDLAMLTLADFPYLVSKANHALPQLKIHG